MNEAVLLVSAAVGILAGLCTLMDFAVRYFGRRSGTEGNAGCSLPQRSRTTHEGPCSGVPQLVEGKEEEDGSEQREDPVNEKSRSPLTKGSRL